MARKDNLEQDIRDSYALVREYEAILQTSDRPAERLRNWREIQTQRELIDGYLREYRAIVNDLPDNIADIAAYIAIPPTAPPDIKNLISPAINALYQLPSPPADFTGRDTELSELIAAIETGGVTISGLRGMGGIGKTVLALKIADRVSPRYPDAQLYLDLRGADPAPLSTAQAMAHVIRAWEPTAQLPETEAGLAPIYRSILHGKRALLLMDNAADRAQVEPLIPPAGCVLLVTSRQHFTLPGMAARNINTFLPAEADAFLLKIEPRIDGHASEIAKLCGCLPFALRVAGSALAERIDLAPAEYIVRLQDEQTRLGLIDASLSLSYNLLDETLRRLWCLLSIFPADFDRLAAAAVWEMEIDAAGDALSRLVRYSLVDWKADLSRYVLHDLARLFAADRRSSCLGEVGAHAAHLRYAFHYKSILSAADALFRQGREATLQGLALFDLERANIEAGQAWIAANWQKSRDVARLAVEYPDAGLYCLNLRLHAQDWIAWLQTSLRAAGEIGDRSGEGTWLSNLGIAYYSLGQVEKAIEYHQQALVISREIGDRSGEGSALGNLGNAYADLGQVEADGNRPSAIGFYEQALVIAREIGDRRAEGAIVGNLGNAYLSLGQVEKAIEYHEQALVIAREIGDRRAEGSIVGNLGLAYAALGQIDKAIGYYEQALVISREIGDRRMEGNGLGSLGLAYYSLGQVEKAIEYHQQALVIAREIGDRRGEGSDLGNLGIAYKDLGQIDKAIGYYEQALVIAREIGDRSGEGIHGWNLGLEYEQSDPARAVELMSVLVRYEQEIGHPDAQADAERVERIRARIEKQGQ